MSVIDVGLRFSHCRAVLTHDQIHAELLRQLDAGEFTAKRVADHLKIAPARVTEMRKGTRRVQQHEMQPLAQFLGMEGVAGDGAFSDSVVDTPEPIPPEVLAPLLAEMAHLWPTGRVSDQSLRALAEALSRGLALLEDSHATQATPREIRMAARVAMSLSRDQVQ